MVEVAGDAGTRRRLPSWMQGGASKLGDGGDKNGNIEEDGDGLVSGNSKPKKQPKKALLAQEKVERNRRKISPLDTGCDVESALPEKTSIDLEESSNPRKRKATNVQPRSDKDRKISPLEDAACDVETALAKKMSIGLEEKKDEESSILRKRKAKTVRSRSSKHGKIEPPVDVDDDDDVDLTPEDLLSIAKEYVKADKDIVMQEQSVTEGEFGRQLSTTASFNTEAEGSLVTVVGKRGSPPHETTYDSTQSLKCDTHFSITNRTGDPAQDMLDLFLGPLLKTTMEEKRTEYIVNDLKLTNEIGKGSRNDVEEETVPLTKKKGTLRDKVAMLLD